MPKLKDLTGQIFGDFTVIEMLPNYNNTRHVYCRCMGIDEKEYIIRNDALTSGATTSIKGACKRGKPIDLIGKKFGRLTVIEKTEKRALNGSIIWKCLCDCGEIAYVSSGDLLRKHKKSCGCLKDDFIESCKIDVVGKKFGLLTIKEIYSTKGDRRKAICDCACGGTYEGTLSDITTGHVSSCGCLSESKGEMYIKNILDELNIEYVSQKRFRDCKNIKTLPFDFYLPKYNCCIEYDGEQHFKSVKHWGGDKKLKQYQINDSIKNEYCLKNKIKLIRINYKIKEKEIRKIINDLISPATITA